MTSVVLQGALYAFCLPDGGWGALYPGSHIQTSDGRVSLPDEDVLFLVGIRSGGRLWLAGQGQNTGAAWLHNGDHWQNCGLTFGVSPCCFNGDALFFVTSGQSYRLISLHDGATADCTAQIGTQGIRYIVGINPVSGDATYASPDGQYYQYTDRGNVRVGQGSDLFALINGRVLETGDCQFIRCEREGDNLAIAIVQLPLHQAVLYRLTVAEIAALPLPSAPVPVPVPTPIPVPVPVPAPMPFDFSSTSIVDSPSDLASWHETATITRVDFSSGKFVVDFDRRTGPGRWPEAKDPRNVPPGEKDPDTQYTLGMCCQIGGRWYGSAVVQFWDDRELAAGGGVDEIGATWFYDGRWRELQGHQPARGELVGIFVAQANIRGGIQHGVPVLRERSAVLLLPWGTNYHSTSPVPVPVPVPVPTPTPVPTVDLSDILRRLAVLEEAHAQPVRVALKTENGHYLTATLGGGGRVGADASHVAGWEVFTVEPQ